ncbi:coiled-coil domain-containing protein 34 isoform X2 [Electrophorus electricus]|uniref:coiled-coil domain-containing protein 34 isoform X2 n=1 Tax=Electrophorus electricus TaxID=8005 RepID=UPI0015CF829F|nr:coiled-coil domain-containing protein 34 isoform X2 [Electrophorus electricus]
MSAFQFASSKSFTSTPLKSKSVPRSIPRSRSVESMGDSTYSLLSPIYHDSFDLSDDDSVAPLKHCQSTTPDNPSPRAQGNVLSVSPSRNETELLHAQDAMCTKTLNLSAWEQWVVSKAREERNRMHQKALEQVLKVQKEQEEREHQRKKVVCECKMQEWLQTKREQEKQERLCRESQKTKELLHEEQKRLEIEKKAQVKYKEWFQKKKQEEMERKVKEQEEMARRENEERERKEKAEEKFKEWLKRIKDRDQHKQQSSPCSARGYDHLNYPAPSFVNPIPWKPIHIPQQNRTPAKKSVYRKQPGPPKYQSTLCISYKPKDTISFSCKRR